MITQLDIFSTPVHRYENNAESESHLKENEKRFSTQCWRVYNLLLAGCRLTRIKAATDFKILSLERRVKDLRENGIEINTEWVKDDRGHNLYKEYFITTNS